MNYNLLFSSIITYIINNTECQIRLDINDYEKTKNVETNPPFIDSLLKMMYVAT